MDTKKNIIIVIILVLTFWYSCSISAQTVSNVTAVQVEKTIHVSYDLDEPANVTLFLSTDGGLNYTELHQVRGHVGENVPTGHNTIVWDVLAERESLTGDDVVFKVRAVAQPRNGKPCPGTPTLKDYDGNTYHTVQIGTQCWMAENLRVTHYSDGTAISLGADASSTIAYRYCPDNNVSNYLAYGYLYNWRAVMDYHSASKNNPSGIQGVCPIGWHLPSVAEWEQLIGYIGNQRQYMYEENRNSVAKSLASTVGWNIYKDPDAEGCEVGYACSKNNSTGFSAFPAGGWWNGYNGFSYRATFWTTTAGENCAWGLFLTFNNRNVEKYCYDRVNAFSVRCLKD